MNSNDESLIDSRNASHSRLLNSIEGTIGTVLLVVPLYEAQKLSAIYLDLINSLEPSTQVILVVEHRAMKIVQAWIDRIQRQDCMTLFIASEELQLTSWACDIFLAGVDSQGHALMYSPAAFSRKDDGVLPQFLNEQLNISRVQSPMLFEGGNILLTEEFCFIGIDSLETLSGKSDSERLEQFNQALYGFDATPRQTIVIQSLNPVPHEVASPLSIQGDLWQEVFHFRNRKGTRQPIFHIDMFLSVAGKTPDGQTILLVGDPRMAAELLEIPLSFAAIADHFDAIAQELKDQGFIVIRNPLPLIYMDEVEKKRRTWFYVSSNNVLVQRSPTANNIVWMPAYGHDLWPELKVTDQANRSLWQDLGFEVRMINNGQLLAENLGGLHCLTNVLERA